MSFTIKFEFNEREVVIFRDNKFDAWMDYLQFMYKMSPNYINNKFLKVSKHYWQDCFVKSYRGESISYE